MQGLDLLANRAALGVVISGAAAGADIGRMVSLALNTLARPDVPSGADLLLIGPVDEDAEGTADAACGLQGVCEIWAVACADVVLVAAKADDARHTLRADIKLYSVPAMRRRLRYRTFAQRCLRTALTL